MSELWLPPVNAKLDSRCDFYETTEEFKRRSRASKEKARKYWADGRHRRRIDKKQAKPVDAFTLDGKFVASFPSSRKAALALYPDKDHFLVERNIRNCRHGRKGRVFGYQFRDHVDNPQDIEPYTRKPHKKGYKVNRALGTYCLKPCRVVFDDGDAAVYNSLKDAAAGLKGTYGGLWRAMKDGRKYKGYKIELIEK